MNSARICWSRRSSETSSRTSHRPPSGARRARSTSAARRPRRPRPRRSPSPRQAPPGRSISTCVSRKASISVRPRSAPGGWSSSVWAAALAATIREPSPTVEDALCQRLDERVAVLGVACPADLERLGPRREVPDRRDRVAVGPDADRLADRAHRASVACGERRDDDERDERHDRGKPCLHTASIAQAGLRVMPAASPRPGARARPAGRPAGTAAATAG